MRAWLQEVQICFQGLVGYVENLYGEVILLLYLWLQFPQLLQEIQVGAKINNKYYN